jgi:hypothetical protein
MDQPVCTDTVACTLIGAQASGQLRNPSRYGYGSPRPVVDLQEARDADARRAASERRELRLDSSEKQHHPAHTLLRFTHKEPTPADHLAARKAVLEVAIDDLRGAGSQLPLHTTMPMISLSNFLALPRDCSKEAGPHRAGRLCRTDPLRHKQVVVCPSIHTAALAQGRCPTCHNRAGPLLPGSPVSARGWSGAETRR